MTHDSSRYYTAELPVAALAFAGPATEGRLDGMDSVGNIGVSHAPLRALPRFGIAFGQKGRAVAL